MEVSQHKCTRSAQKADNKISSGHVYILKVLPEVSKNDDNDGDSKYARALTRNATATYLYCIKLFDQTVNSDVTDLMSV